MRSLQNHYFAKNLMRIENGIEPTKHGDMVKIPPPTCNNMRKRNFNTKDYIRNISPIRISYIGCILYGTKSHTNAKK